LAFAWQPAVDVLALVFLMAVYCDIRSKFFGVHSLSSIHAATKVNTTECRVMEERCKMSLFTAIVIMAFTVWVTSVFLIITTPWVIVLWVAGMMLQPLPDHPGQQFIKAALYTTATLRL
jgi:hypothetical protein